MSVSKKKKTFLSIFIPSLILTIFVFTFGIYWSVELLLRGHYTKEGIDNYSPAASSISLCGYLTLKEERIADEYFVNKRPYIDSYYRYEYDYNSKYKCETVILSLTYSKNVYEEAYKEISAQPGFSKKIWFNYHNYSFCLNDTERMMHNAYRQDWCYTSYDISDNCIKLSWINLVGWCDDKDTLVFIGFFYDKNKSGYEFNNFGELFELYFNTYVW